MKIEKMAATDATGMVKTENSVQKSDFAFTLKGKLEEAEFDAQLKAMVEKINEQGDVISEHMDIKDVMKYKDMIKDFINEVVTHTHKFSKENFLDKRGRHKVYGIIRLVDKELDELAQEVLQEEKSHINILDHIDEIRGLLLDILT